MKTRALTFDVFGTVADWRGTIIREGREFNEKLGLNVDWAAFADAWRGLYQPSVSQVRNGKRPWTNLDQLHLESLVQLVDQFGQELLNPRELDRLHRVWHRLHPWPDAVEGLWRLKHRFILASLSNGNVALLVNMAWSAGLPWDTILGAEVAGYYKPQPPAYLLRAQLLGLKPNECMMVAAHNDDLEAAMDCSFQTAFICRPMEYGPSQTSDLRANRDWNITADDLIDLAWQLGC